MQLMLVRGLCLAVTGHSSLVVRGLCLAVTGHSSLVVRDLDLAVRGDLGSATLQLFVVFFGFFFFLLFLKVFFFFFERCLFILCKCTVAVFRHSRRGRQFSLRWL